MRRLVGLTTVTLLLTACATMINSEQQSVLIVSYPPEAEVWVDDIYHIRSPGKVTLSRLADHVAVVEKEGYEPKKVTITRSMSWSVLWNFFCLIFVVQCVQSDREDGGYYTFDDKVIVKLNKKE